MAYEDEAGKVNFFQPLKVYGHKMKNGEIGVAVRGLDTETGRMVQLHFMHRDKNEVRGFLEGLVETASNAGQT
jgi:hypothetical protein